MLVNSVAQTTFVPKKTVALLNDILRETRVVRTMSFDPSAYMKDVKVSEEQIKKYYDEHKDDYRAPESLNIQFVVMSPETVKMTAEPSEQELKDFYEQNRKKYEVEESRRAAHILIAPDANEADKAKADQDAKAKAEKILAEVKADPSKFAQLAKENSADPGTAESGGDLDSSLRPDGS